MEPLPTMWRVELAHPLFVHLPIALLFSGTLVWLIGSWVDRDGRWGFLEPAGRLALAAGALLAWIAVYTGDLANAEVARTLCDPTVKKDHEDLAYVTAAVFSGAIAIDLAALYFGVKGRLRTIFAWITGLALVAGVVVLSIVGHSGAQLVYQQGAAVYKPSPQCTEFE